MPRRASNEKNGAAREKWMKDKVVGRTKQVFTLYTDGRIGGYWTRVKIEDKEEE
jgi:hypothetical protein